MSGWGIPDNNFTLKRKNLVLEAVAVNLSAGTGRIISIHFKLNCSDFLLSCVVRQLDGGKESPAFPCRDRLGHSNAWLQMLIVE